MIAELNLSEFVWSDAKGDFSRRNACFKADQMVPEIQRSLEKIPHERFQEYWGHVVKQAKIYFEVKTSKTSDSNLANFSPTLLNAAPQGPPEGWGSSDHHRIGGTPGWNPSCPKGCECYKRVDL